MCSLRAVGDHSEVFEGINMHTMDKVALKMEYDRARPSVYSESEKLKILEGCIGIPLLYYIGREGDYKIMVTELLGEDLSRYLESCQGSFSMKTTLMIADQIVSILEFMHGTGLVYNDFKPDNFCVGGESNFFHIHMIDFALCNSFKDVNGNFVTEQTVEDDISMEQDVLFSPIASHLRKARYPKDDLESLIYMMIYFMTGTLPWAKILISDELDDMSKAS